MLIKVIFNIEPKFSVSEWYVNFFQNKLSNKIIPHKVNINKI